MGRIIIAYLVFARYALPGIMAGIAMYSQQYLLLGISTLLLGLDTLAVRQERIKQQEMFAHYRKLWKHIEKLETEQETRFYQENPPSPLEIN